MTNSISNLGGFLFSPKNRPFESQKNFFCPSSQAQVGPKFDLALLTLKDDEALVVQRRRKPLVFQNTKTGSSSI